MEKDYYFIFNGINSKKYGIEISKFYPITKPQKNIESISIPGRNNDLHIDYGTYNSYSITIECVINPFNKNKQNIDEIITWLDGFGELITSQEPDKIYEAVVFQPISIEEVIWVFPKFLVTFNVQPLKKSVNHINEHIEITKKTTINNIGTVKSSPKITIYGTGNVTLFVNNNEFTIKNIEEFIVIDSEFLEVYKNNINQNNKFSNFSFPIFEIGKNVLNFTGNVEKIIIEPKWRWI